jgi:hypothetical protein
VVSFIYETLIHHQSTLGWETYLQVLMTVLWGHCATLSTTDTAMKEMNETGHCSRLDELVSMTSRYLLVLPDDYPVIVSLCPLLETTINSHVIGFFFVMVSISFNVILFLSHPMKNVSSQP